MQRVLQFIERNLDADLNVDLLSSVAAFSKHHFQRQFSNLFGISVGRYIQLLRMHRASRRLAFRPSDRIIEIALDSGFEGPEAFARSFRRHFDQSPSGFRRDPLWSSWHAALEPLQQARRTQMANSFSPDDVRIIDFPDTPVAVLQHRGDPRRVNESVRQFIEWRRSSGHGAATSRTFNVFHSDPEQVEAEEFRMDLCATSGGSVEPNAAGIIEGLIPAGRCAVLEIEGPGDDLRAASHYLYGQWLPASGEEPREFPFFVERLNVGPGTPDHKCATRLYLPLA
ncbi:MAG: AraC family transcriptional regulator [Sphingomicrobium sp.]